MLFDYSAGFIRRGLIGTLAFPGDGPVSFVAVSAIAVGVFPALMATLFLASIQIICRYPTLRLVPLLFASSMGVVFAASTVGYFDHFLVLIVAAPLLLPDLVPRLVLAVVGSIVAVLIHEAALLVTTPVLLTALALSLDGRRLALPILTGLGAALVLVTLTVFSFGTLGTEAAMVRRDLIEARASFPLSDLAFEIVTGDPYDHAARWTAVLTPGAHVLSVLIVAPALLPLFAIALQLGLRMHLSGIAMLAITTSCLSPMLVRFAGADLQRWDALAIVTCFLTLAIMLRDCRALGAVPTCWHNLQPVLAGALAISASSRSFLFEGQSLSLYPFLEVFFRARHWITSWH